LDTLLGYKGGGKPLLKSRLKRGKLASAREVLIAPRLKMRIGDFHHSRFLSFMPRKLFGRTG